MPQAIVGRSVISPSSVCQQDRARPYAEKNSQARARSFAPSAVRVLPVPSPDASVFLRASRTCADPQAAAQPAERAIGFQADEGTPAKPQGIHGRWVGRPDRLSAPAAEIL